MLKAFKKPIEIEWVQWWRNGDHPHDGMAYEMPARYEGKIVRYYRHPDVDGQTKCERCGLKMHDHGWIDTLEGGHNVCPGDVIITGVQGEHYPCKPDIFYDSYNLGEGWTDLDFKFPEYLGDKKYT